MAYAAIPAFPEYQDTGRMLNDKKRADEKQNSEDSNHTTFSMLFSGMIQEEKKNPDSKSDKVISEKAITEEVESSSKNANPKKNEVQNAEEKEETKLEKSLASTNLFLLKKNSLFKKTTSGKIEITDDKTGNSKDVTQNSGDKSEKPDGKAHKFADKASSEALETMDFSSKTESKANLKEAHSENAENAADFAKEKSTHKQAFENPVKHIDSSKIETDQSTAKEVAAVNSSVSKEAAAIKSSISKEAATENSNISKELSSAKETSTKEKSPIDSSGKISPDIEDKLSELETSELENSEKLSSKNHEDSQNYAGVTNPSESINSSTGTVEEKVINNEKHLSSPEEASKTEETEINQKFQPIKFQSLKRENSESENVEVDKYSKSNDDKAEVRSDKNAEQNESANKKNGTVSVKSENVIALTQKNLKTSVASTEMPEVLNKAKISNGLSATEKSFNGDMKTKITADLQDYLKDEGSFDHGETKEDTYDHSKGFSDHLNSSSKFQNSATGTNTAATSAFGSKALQAWQEMSAKMLKNGRAKGSIQLDMNPESLGKVVVKLQLKGSGVEARFEAVSQESAETLRSSMHTLKQSLQNMGLELTRTDIVVPEGYEDQRRKEERGHEGKKKKSANTEQIESQPDFSDFLAQGLDTGASLNIRA